jgi:hypothetical protein
MQNLGEGKNVGKSFPNNIPYMNEIFSVRQK